jgi:endosialidase-like protein
MRHAGHRVALAAGAVACWLIGGTGEGVRDVAAAGGESAFVGLTPCRLADTRGNGFADPFGPPALVTGVPREFPLQGQCGIPATATAVSLNVTATGTQGPGFLLLYPQGGAQPLVSTLNYVAGETVANAAIVPLGPGGLTVVAGVAGTDLILDVDGYFRDALVHGVILDNLFVGRDAGANHSIGSFNTAVGADALGGSSSGNSNTAVGRGALYNTASNGNTALGSMALTAQTSGGNNTAVGQLALSFLQGGIRNIALGLNAGGILANGDDNIYIGGSPTADESQTIRIGNNNQQRAFIHGIRGVTTGSANTLPVLIDNAGQLGTASSSRRVKTDIEPVGERSRGLHALRPVSFRYRVHPPGGPVEYGLIAEEVAEVYPELVVRDAEGAPETVRYHLLPALLLNELQRVVVEKDRQIAELAAALAELAAEVARLKERGPIAAGHGGHQP